MDSACLSVYWLLVTYRHQIHSSINTALGNDVKSSKLFPHCVDLFDSKCSTNFYSSDSKIYTNLHYHYYFNRLVNNFRVVSENGKNQGYLRSCAFYCVLKYTCAIVFQCHVYILEIYQIGSIPLETEELCVER